MANDRRRLPQLWGQHCPPRCIQPHALRKLLHTALGNVFRFVVQVRVGLRVEGRFFFFFFMQLPPLKGATQLASPLARRVSFFEDVGGQLHASLLLFASLMTRGY